MSPSIVGADPTSAGSPEGALADSAAHRSTPGAPCRRRRAACRRRPPCPGRRAREFFGSSGSARSYQRAITRMVAAFHGVWCPTTLAEAGSDLHRACLTRLCCAFRFSQPLDALFRLQPLQPCFMPVTPLGFHLQRVPLPGSGHVSRRYLPFVPFRLTGQDVGQDESSPAPAPRVCASEESVHSNPVLPGCCRPILSWRSPLRGFPHCDLGSMLPRSLLSWALSRRWVETHRRVRSSEYQRTTGWLASFENCLPP